MTLKKLIVFCVIFLTLTTNGNSATQQQLQKQSESGMNGMNGISVRSNSRTLMAHKTQGWEKGFMSGESGCLSVVKNGLICGFTAVSAGFKCAWSYIKCIIPKCDKCCAGGWFSWLCAPCRCSWNCSSKTCKEEFNKVGKACEITADDCIKAFKGLGAATQKFFKDVANGIKFIANKIAHAAKWVAEKAWAAVKWVWDKIKSLLDLIKIFEVASAIGKAFQCFGKLGSKSQIESASKRAGDVKGVAQSQGKNGVISKIDSFIPGFKAFVCCLQSTAIGKVLNKWGKKLLDFHRNWKGLKIGSFIDDPAIVVSLAASVFSGYSAGTSLDIAFSTAFNVGLYWTVCAGFVTDVGAGVSIVVNLFRKWTFIPGQSVAISFSVGIPSTPIGVGAGVVLPIGSSGVDFGAVNVEVGASNGVSPVSIGGHVCDTIELVSFNLLELIGNILTAGNECPSNIPSGGSSSSGGSGSGSGSAPSPAPLTNLARGRPTWQSSTGWGGSSSRAVDGNKSTSYGSNSCTHTNNDNNPWWTVDLGKATRVTVVKIYNRRDCCSDRLQNIDIKLSMDNSNFVNVAYKAGKQTNQSVVEIAVPATALPGRYLRIQLRARTYLTLCEVEVYGVPDLAQGRPTTQVDCNSGCWGGVSSRAVQGKIGQRWPGTCTHTGNRNGAWWQVDLGSNKKVDQVVIYNRQDCCSSRLQKTEIAYSTNGSSFSRAWYKASAFGSVTSATFNQVTARYLRIRFVSYSSYLTLCGVQVFGAGNSALVIEEMNVENNRRMMSSHEILTSHKEKLIENEKLSLREALKAKRRLEEEEDAERLAEIEEARIAMENTYAQPAGFELSQHQISGKKIPIDPDMCGSGNTDATVAFVNQSGVGAKSKTEVAKDLCSNACKPQQGKKLSNKCYDLIGDTCLKGWLGGDLKTVGACCNAVRSKPENLMFRLHQFCAGNGLLKEPSKQEFCAALGKSAAEMRTKFSIVDTIVDGCVKFKANACNKLAPITTADGMVTVAKEIANEVNCNGKTLQMDQMTGAVAGGLVLSFLLIFVGVKKIRGSKNGDYRYEELPDF